MLRKSMTSFRKKANVGLELIFIIIGIVVFAMVVVFGWAAFKDISTDVSNDLELQEAKDTITEVETRYPFVFDGLVLFVMIGLWVGGIVSAYTQNEHPLIFGFMIIIIIFVVIAAAMIANYFEETFEDDELNTLMASYPKTNWVITHLLELTIMMAVSIAIVLYAKRRAG